MTHRPRVVFVDHSGAPGGGQLGLLRYLRSSTEVEATVLQLGTGDVFDKGSGAFALEILSPWDGAARQHLLVGRLRRKIKSIAPDLVVANSTRAASIVALTPRLRGVSYVCHLRDDLNPVRNSVAKIAYMTNFVLPKYDAILANSNWTLSTVPDRIVRSRRTAVAHPVCGVSAALQPKTQGDPVRFLSLSRLDRWKGIHLILEATAKLEAEGYEGRFVIEVAGAATHADIRYEEELKRLSKNLITDVIFHGHVEDASQLLRSSDSLICASVTPEPFGQVVVQGMAAGLVVIASDHGGPVEMLQEGSGVLVKPDDSADLARAMRFVIEASPGVREMRQRATQRSTDYADAATIAQMDSFLSHVSPKTVAR